MQYLIYGKHSSIECLKNNKREILRVFCSEIFCKTYREIISKFKFDIVSSHYLDNLVKGANHQGVVIETCQINVSLEKAADLCNRIVILDCITDPQNVGAIVRSAVAFGFDGLVSAKTNALGENGTIARVASGALEHINLLQVTNISRTIEYLKNKGFWTIGLDCNATQFVEHSLMNSPKLVIVLGAEGSGLRPLVRKSCDVLVKIPMHTGASSINVSNAASIAFYIASRQIKEPKR